MCTTGCGTDGSFYSTKWNTCWSECSIALQHLTDSIILILYCVKCKCLTSIKIALLLFEEIWAGSNDPWDRRLLLEITELQWWAEAANTPLHSEVGWTHRGFRLDVSRNLPYESQNFRTMSGNRVPKRKIWSEIPIPRNGRSKFSPDVVSFYAEKILFVIVGKIFEHI